MKKKAHGHVNHERYLVTYSDLITLLLAFFIILYAMSSPDESKLEALAEQLTLAFHPSAESLLPQLNSQGGESRQRGQAATSEEQKTMESVSEQSSLRKVKEKIDEEAGKQGVSGEIQTKLTDEGLKIVLTDDILFNSGSATLKDEKSTAIIGNIGLILSTINNPVTIDGHTDNIPISNSQYPSNWELSAARSLSVLREMVNFTPKLDPTRFSASGYGEYRPVADNSVEHGRKANRRVEILVKRENQDGLLKAGGESKK
ncbi:flagellar motor protein MotB [Bacillus mexicanus]|uniref:flagellar motor protein MotB n=1 Tax=Bacillus mexicanus TaxID=2834415 RepID=UPI003D1A748E